MKIIIEPYNANWKHLFNAEAKLLQNSLAHYNIKIEYHRHTNWGTTKKRLAI